MTSSGQPPPGVEGSCDEHMHRLCEADNSLRTLWVPHHEEEYQDIFEDVYPASLVLQEAWQLAIFALAACAAEHALDGEGLGMRLRRLCPTISDRAAKLVEKWGEF